ncbi:hypothetical protein [Aeromicrobium panaciterrae]|nr:hypothetical protein [Aeromicrobium panaciterrae]
MRLVKDGPQRSTVIFSSIIALLVAALAIVLWNGRGGDEDDSTVRLDVLAAATSAAGDMTTYSYRHLDRDFAWVDDAGTASFKKEYGPATKQLSKVVTKLEGKAVGAVVEAAVTLDGSDRATVLLFVDQTITNGKDSKIRTERNRVVMSMVKSGSDWLVDDVELR